MSKKPDMKAAMLAATVVLGLTRKQRDVVSQMLAEKAAKEDAANAAKGKTVVAVEV